MYPVHNCCQKDEINWNWNISNYTDWGIPVPIIYGRLNGEKLVCL